MTHSPFVRLNWRDWLARYATDLEEIAPINAERGVWFAAVDGDDVFIKWHAPALRDTRVRIEVAISGAHLHPAIIPLWRKIDCADGILLLYPKRPGDNLGSMEVRNRFSALPLEDRIRAVVTVVEALAAIAEAGFMIVDWYEGNMLYDFAARQICLFDWELCREGESFVLEMDANYGSSRLMAPEEFVRGSILDQRTLVFNAGRYALLNLPELAEPLADVLSRATYPAPAGRYPTLRAFVGALSEAIVQLQN